MTTETTQETVEDANTLLLAPDNSAGKGSNPFRTAPPKKVVQAAEVEEEYDESEDAELDEEELKAKKAIAKKSESKPVEKGSALEDIKDIETLQKMVRETRREAAKARTEKNKELAEFEEWKEAQKTEQQRVLDKAEKRASEAEERLHRLLADKIVLEYNVAEDLAEFVTGATEDEMREKAEKLRDTGAPKRRRKATAEEDEEDEPKKKSPGLLGGRRGTPISKTKTTDEWFNDLIRKSG